MSHSEQDMPVVQLGVVLEHLSLQVMLRFDYLCIELDLSQKKVLAARGLLLRLGLFKLAACFRHESEPARLVLHLAIFPEAFGRQENRECVEDAV